jgi:hypothetical protein
LQEADNGVDAARGVAAWGGALEQRAHTGISRSPCAAVPVPSITCRTRSAGNSPPLRVANDVRSGCIDSMNESTRSRGNAPRFDRASAVRSAGFVFRAAAVGPPPRPSRPWQLAQYRSNDSDPTSDSGTSGGSACRGPCASATAAIVSHAPASTHMPRVIADLQNRAVQHPFRPTAGINAR